MGREEEWFVRSSIIDESEITPAVSDNLDVLAVVESPMGPAVPTKVHSLGEFKKLYVDSNVPLTDSQLSAMNLLTSGVSLVVKRSASAPYLVGMSNTGLPVKTDHLGHTYGFENIVKVRANEVPLLPVWLKDTAKKDLYVSGTHTETGFNLRDLGDATSVGDFLRLLSYQPLPACNIAHQGDKYALTTKGVVFDEYSNNLGVKNSGVVKAHVGTISILKDQADTIMLGGEKFGLRGFSGGADDHSWSSVAHGSPRELLARITNYLINKRPSNVESTDIVSELKVLKGTSVQNINIKANTFLGIIEDGNIVSTTKVTTLAKEGRLELEINGVTYKFVMGTAPASDEISIPASTTPNVTLYNIAERLSIPTLDVLVLATGNYMSVDEDFLNHSMVNDTLFDVVKESIEMNTLTIDDQPTSATELLTKSFIKIGANYYYSGTIANKPEGAIELKGLTSKEFLDEVLKRESSTFLLNGQELSKLALTDSIIDVASSTDFTIRSHTDPIDTGGTAKFMVLSKSPSMHNPYYFETKVDPNDSEIFNLIIYTKDESETYRLSFSKELDSYGVDIRYNKVNRLSSNFMIKVNEDVAYTPHDYVSPKFGSGSGYRAPSVSDMLVTMEELAEARKFFYMISQSGLYNGVFIKGIHRIGADYNAFVPISSPPTILEANEIISYFDSLNLNTFQSIQYAGFYYEYREGKERSVPLSNLYITNVIQSIKSGDEFIPRYGMNNSHVGVRVHDLLRFSKETRQKLLDHHINSVQSDELGNSFFNSNRTTNSILSSLSEDNNVRMVNEISKTTEKQCRNYIGKISTKKFRATATGEIEQAITSRVVTGKTVRPIRFIVKCDDENNTAEKTNNFRSLIVDIYAILPESVRYVKIYTHVVRLIDGEGQ